MEPFIKCPQCGDYDDPRTQCTCGYPDSPPSYAEGFTRNRRPKQPEVDNDLKTRIAGFLMLMAGSFLSYFSVYLPLHQGAQQDEKVTISMKGALFCPMGIGMGLALLGLGKQTNEVFGTRAPFTPLAWIYGFVLILVGFGLYYYVQSSLQDLGYQTVRH